MAVVRSKVALAPLWPLTLMVLAPEVLLSLKLPLTAKEASTGAVVPSALL